MVRRSLIRALFYTHRWLGIVCCGLFALWFVSGVVMMYARMPRLTAEERLMRLPPLAMDAARVAPAEAARHAGYSADDAPERLRIGMLQGRPVYRFARGNAWRAVFADTGEVFGGLSPEAAIDLLRQFAPEHATSIRYEQRLDDADQWTLSSVVRAQRPLHRLALGDDAGTELYVSDRTGDVVMKTDARGRLWGYLGAVVHWVYFTPLRRNGALWAEVIVYGSIVGCLMCLSGLAAGLWRWSRVPRYRLRGAAAPARSPYAGAMKWHHYGGLVFGLVTFTWILSGLFSMNPFDWSPGNTPTADERRVLSGGALALDELDVAALATSAGRLASAFPLREMEAVRFAGAQYFTAFRPPAAADTGEWTNTDLAAFLSPQTALERGIVRAGDRDGPLLSAFDRTALERLTRAAGAGAAVVDARWLDAYDDYYYDRAGGRPLPVFRVQFDDPARTWLYADPGSGTLVDREQRRSRLERWLYHGLHSLDFPGFYARRPLWDVVVIVLSAGGLALSGTALLLAFRRLRRLYFGRRSGMSAIT